MDYEDFLIIRHNNRCQIERFFQTFRFRHLEKIIFDDGKFFRDQKLTGLNNFWDAIPSAIHGFVPSCKRSGADAIQVKPDGTVVLHELKLASINSTLIRRGPLGGLFLVRQEDIDEDEVDLNKTSAINSYVSAHFSKEVKNHIPRDTTLTVYDQATSHIVGAYTIPAAGMKKIFKTISKSKSVKINVFQREGTAIQPFANIPFTNWNDYCTLLSETAKSTKRY